LFKHHKNPNSLLLFQFFRGQIATAPHLALLRFAIKSMLGFISLFAISSNKDRKAIHDIASGSIVLYR
jgi:uncharacterized RDD family membrane protein YckC